MSGRVPGRTMWHTEPGSSSRNTDSGLLPQTQNSPQVPHTRSQAEPGTIRLAGTVPHLAQEFVTSGADLNMRDEVSTKPVCIAVSPGRLAVWLHCPPSCGVRCQRADCILVTSAHLMTPHCLVLEMVGRLLRSSADPLMADSVSGP